MKPSSSGAAFDDGAAREDVQVLDDEARFLRENYLRLAFYAARELAERRAQEIVDLPLRRADALAVIMLHNFGMLYLSEVRPLRLSRLDLDEEAVALFRIPDKN